MIMMKRYTRSYRSIDAIYEGLEDFSKEITFEPMLQSIVCLENCKQFRMIRIQSICRECSEVF